MPPSRSRDRGRVSGALRRNVARTFAEGDSLCGSGYYHGVLERSLVNVRSREPDVLAPVARTLCDDAAAMSPWIAYQCLHGLGHGLMIATGLNLPIALQVCSRLRRWWDGDACRSGVFMENLSSSYGVRSLWLRDEDPVYPCNSVRDRGQAALLPDGDVSNPPVRRRRLDPDGRDVHLGGAARASTCASGRSGETRRAGVTGTQPTRSRRARSRGRTGARTSASGRPRRMSSRTSRAARAPGRCARRCRASLAEPCFEGLGSAMGRLRKTVDARAADCRALTSSDVLVEACMRGGRSALPRT